MTKDEILTTAAKICVDPGYPNTGTGDEQEYLGWLREECTKKLIELLRTRKPLARISFWCIGKALDSSVASYNIAHNTDIKVCDIRDITDSEDPALEGMNLAKLSIMISTAGESVMSLVNHFRYNNILYQGRRVFVGFGEDEPIFNQRNQDYSVLSANGIML